MWPPPFHQREEESLSFAASPSTSFRCAQVGPKVMSYLQDQWGTRVFEYLSLSSSPKPPLLPHPPHVDRNHALLARVPGLGDAVKPEGGQIQQVAGPHLAGSAAPGAGGC